MALGPHGKLLDRYNRAFTMNDQRVSCIRMSNRVAPDNTLLPEGVPQFDIVMTSMSTAFCDTCLISWIDTTTKVIHCNPHLDDKMMASDEHHSSINVKTLTKKWHIDLQPDCHTLKSTTQRHSHHAFRPLSYRYCTDTQVIVY